MKLNVVLSQVNQVERAKFISCLDKVRNKAIASDSQLAQKISNIDGQLRSASDSEIMQLFTPIKQYFSDYIREEVSLGGAQLALLINILSRDGNCIARTSWIETLYTRESDRLEKLSKEIQKEIDASVDENEFGHGTRLSTYKDCVEAAYLNDLRHNREAKISDDERIILNTLSERLGLTRDEAFAVENIVVPTPKGDVAEVLNHLREIGIIFINKRSSEVLVPDEIVSMLHEIQQRELTDKHSLRILRSFSDAELSIIMRAHGQKSRGVSRTEKIRFITHSGMSIRGVLSRDIYDANETQNQRKDRLKLLIDDLGIETPKLGVTLNDRIDVIIQSLKDGVEKEFELLSASGFKDLVSLLSTTTPPVIERLRDEFEIEDNETLDPERLRSLSISPVDILYVYSNEEIKKVRDDLGLSKRINPRTAILENFASANDKLIENYGMLARRDLSGLSSVGVDIREADIGSKFEEVTRTIFEQLGLNVDEDLRKQVNTAKDKADILLSIGGDDVIVGEVKSFKNGDYAKYSTTSRQVKAYVNRCESNGSRVAQVLIVAPSFSQDFIDSAEMDTDINISLLEADGLQKILNAYNARRNPKFSAKLLTKGGLLKTDLIAKTI